MDFIKRMVMPDKIRVDTKIWRATEPRSRLSDGQQNLVILLSGGKSTCPGLTDKWNFEPWLAEAAVGHHFRLIMSLHCLWSLARSPVSKLCKSSHVALSIPWCYQVCFSSCLLCSSFTVVLILGLNIWSPLHPSNILDAADKDCLI